MHPDLPSDSRSSGIPCGRWKLKDNPSTSDLPIFERLDYSKQSFNRLCELGCNPQVLSLLLKTLCSLRESSSLRINKRKAESIAARAGKMLEEVNYLGNLGIANALLPSINLDHPSEAHQPGTRLKQYFETRFLLFDLITDFLKSLMALPTLIKGIDKEEFFREHRSGIHKYVRSSTGGWRDALLADIWNDLFPYSDPDKSHTEDALKLWRNRHELKG